MVVVQLLGEAGIYSRLDLWRSWRNLLKDFGGHLSALDRVTYFIVVSQQFQTSSVRHQAHTDQNVENKQVKK